MHKSSTIATSAPTTGSSSPPNKERALETALDELERCARQNAAQTKSRTDSMRALAADVTARLRPQRPHPNGLPLPELRSGVRVEFEWSLGTVEVGTVIGSFDSLGQTYYRVQRDGDPEPMHVLHGDGLRPVREDPVVIAERASRIDAVKGLSDRAI